LLGSSRRSSLLDEVGETKSVFPGTLLSFGSSCPAQFPEVRQ
jgi:hypothetical protein